MEIPGYKIIRKLGQGAMATVYLALHEMLDREVALKVMAPSLAADPSLCSPWLAAAVGAKGIGCRVSESIF